MPQKIFYLNDWNTGHKKPETATKSWSSPKVPDDWEHAEATGV